MIVEFLSTPISTMVCRLRNCSASGSAVIVLDVFWLHDGDLDAPVLGLPSRISRLFWLIVAVSASVWSSVWRPTTAGMRGPRDLADGRGDVLDRYDRANRVRDLVAGDRGHVDAHVVAGGDD